jgi:hypothetical protein
MVKKTWYALLLAGGIFAMVGANNVSTSSANSGSRSGNAPVAISICAAYMIPGVGSGQGSDNGCTACTSDGKISNDRCVASIHSGTECSTESVDATYIQREKLYYQGICYACQSTTQHYQRTSATMGTDSCSNDPS